jgi:small conductance mechanosensitive channel
MDWVTKIIGALRVGVSLVVVSTWSAVCLAQLPAVVAQGIGSKPAAAGKEAPKAAATEGTITVHQEVPDATLAGFLQRFLPEYPGVRTVKVGVRDGVVTLSGRVDDDDSRNEVTEVVKKVQGVRVVMNQMNTDDEVMSAWEFAAGEFKGLWDYFAKKWLLMLLAALIIVSSAFVARVFAAHSELILAPFVRNVLLRSVVGSVISSLVMIGGVVMALGALRLTQAVMSILGVSGLVVLAVGFAFRDITENFIASVLLGVRRPFQIGDYVTVAGQSGIVKSLNTRATVLVSLEGNHVRIPNATVFKEIMVNSTASPSFRSNFDVVIPYEASTAEAIEAINRALAKQKGIRQDPAPRALVEALEPGGVKIRVYFWVPTQNVDWFLLLSEVKLQVKVALQQAGVLGAAVGTAVATGGGGGANGASGNGSVTSEDAAANLKRDVKATVHAVSASGNGRANAVERVLDQPETRVSEEGTNLLKEGRGEG